MPEQVHPSYSFVVQIDGFEDVAFAEATGLGSHIAVVEYRDGSDPAQSVRALPGLVRYDRLVLRRGVAPNFELWEWHRATAEGNVERRNGTISVLDRGREPVVAWRFRNAWVASYRGPDLLARANAVAIETVELVHEGLLREAP